MELSDGPTRPALVERLRDSGKYTHIELTIVEGRNRQVRRMPNLRRLFFFAVALAVLATAAGLLPPALVRNARWAALRGLLLLGLVLALVLALRRISRVASFAILALVAVDLGIPANRLAGFGSAATLMRIPPASRCTRRQSKQSRSAAYLSQPNLESGTTRPRLAPMPPGRTARSALCAAWRRIRSTSLGWL